MAPAPVAAVLGPGAEFTASDGDRGALETRRILWTGVEEAAGLVCVWPAQQRGGLPALRVLAPGLLEGRCRAGPRVRSSPCRDLKSQLPGCPAPCMCALSLRGNPALWAGAAEVAGPPSKCPECTETKHQSPALLGCPDFQLAGLSSCRTLAFCSGVAFLWAVPSLHCPGLQEGEERFFGSDFPAWDPFPRAREQGDRYSPSSKPPFLKTQVVGRNRNHSLPQITLKSPRKLKKFYSLTNTGICSICSGLPGALELPSCMRYCDRQTGKAQPYGRGAAVGGACWGALCRVFTCVPPGPGAGHPHGQVDGSVPTAFR